MNHLPGLLFIASLHNFHSDGLQRAPQPTRRSVRPKNKENSGGCEKGGGCSRVYLGGSV